MEENYKIYAHVNKENGKIYIGQTGQENVNDRWDSGHGYKNCVVFNRAIQKYGWNNFVHIVLFENLSLDMANIVEVELIKKYKSNNNRFGYNINSGGRNCKMSESTKEKLRQMKLGTHASLETRRKLSEHWQKYGHPFTGRHHSEMTKFKISMANKGHRISDKQKMFLSDKFSGEGNPFYGKSHTDDTKNILRKKTIERYKHEENPFKGKKHSNESKEKMSNAHKEIPKEKHGRYGKHNSDNTINAIRQANNKAVNQYDKNMNYINTYESGVSAAKAVGCSKDAISHCCRGKSKTCMGYIFRYVEEMEVSNLVG